MSRRFLLCLVLGIGVAAVSGLCGVIFFLAWQNRQNAGLLVVAKEAYERRDYQAAIVNLASYLAHDANHEEAWKCLALSLEECGQWPEAAEAWRRLSSLNVLEEEYQRRRLEACYRSHDYEALDKALAALPAGKREEYQAIDALAQFKVRPDEPATAALVQELPENGATARLIRCLKSTGPWEELASELEWLERLEAEPVIRVEACMLDAFWSEKRLHDLERAEACLRQAAEVTPFLCRQELGDFLFRHQRYAEAAAEYQSASMTAFREESLLNYAETLFYAKDEEGLAALDRQIPRERDRVIPIRGYVQSLLALRQGDYAKMAQNYKVAQMRRTTPMGMLLNFAVAAENGDAPLMIFVLEQWSKSKEFSQKQAEMLPSARPLVAKSFNRQNWHEAARLASFFVDMQPPDPVVLEAVLEEQVRDQAVSMPLLEQALELYPEERHFARMALQVAKDKGDVEAVKAAYDRLIALDPSSEPERYGKALYLEQAGQTEAAFEELLRLREAASTPSTAKHLLAFGMRTGHEAALRLVQEQMPELAELAQFERLRRQAEDPAEVEQFLADHMLEQGLDARRPEDREILLPLAMYLGVSRQYVRASAAYEQLLPYFEDNVAFWLNLSELYAAQGNAKKALDYASEVYRRFPEMPPVRVIYGVRCAENGDFDRAVKLLPDDVKDAKVREILVACLEKSLQDNFAHRRYPECQRLLQRLQALAPDNACAAEVAERLQAEQKRGETSDAK